VRPKILKSKLQQKSSQENLQRIFKISVVRGKEIDEISIVSNNNYHSCWCNSHGDSKSMGILSLKTDFQRDLDVSPKFKINTLYQ